MIFHPLPGTRVKTGPNPMDVEPPPPVKHGRVVKFLNAVVNVAWDNGTETWILGEYLDPE